ncbi:MAG TPA: response regulator [bacterium (Candidatus Stahlbacteria)]|nr:response regulator [Candidatus Stahlbacteria bacterium]
MSKQILVVDDEPYMVKLLEYNLRKGGYEVITAYNGYEALQKVEQTKPDLIIADVKMPQMDGYELCRRLRSNAETKSIPFVFLTAKGQISERIEGLKKGADDYITKPFNPQELLARIEATLLKKRVPGQPISELTQISDHVHFLKYLEEEIDHAKRYLYSFALALIHLEDYKTPDDTPILKEFIAFLSSQLRKVDIIGRYGDNFAIIMPQMSQVDAKVRLERISKLLEETTFGLTNETAIKIAIQFGVASFPTDGEKVDDLMASARQALHGYQKLNKIGSYSQ